MILGIMQQMITLIIGLIVPRLFIATFGSETNGVISTIANIFSYLSIVEAGVGTAALQALYGTIGKNDNDGSNAILSAVNIYYKKAGLIYFIGVILLAVVYPFSITTKLSYGTIFGLVILSGMGGVLNFWFQAKYKLYLQAEGKNYIMSVMTIVVYLCSNFAKIVLILLGYNVIVVYVAYFTINIGQMLFVLIYIKKNYRWINVKVKPNLDAISQKTAVLVQQITWMICSNTDILVLTYVGKDLSAVSVYAVYLMVYDMIHRLFTNAFGSFHYLLGQRYNQDPKGYVSLHDTYETVSMAVSFGLYTTAYLLITPFLNIYTRGITDAHYVDTYLPLLFTVMHLLSAGREASSRVINFAKHFKQMQWRAILESVINIVVSIVLVMKLGIYGVLIGTIVAYCYRTNDIILYASKYLLNRTAWITYKRWIVNGSIFIGFMLLNRVVDLNVESFFWFLVEAIPVCVFTCGVYLVAICIYDRKEMVQIQKISRNILLKRNKNM